MKTLKSHINEALHNSTENYDNMLIKLFTPTSERFEDIYYTLLKKGEAGVYFDLGDSERWNFLAMRQLGYCKNWYDGKFELNGPGKKAIADHARLVKSLGMSTCINRAINLSWKDVGVNVLKFDTY